MWVKSAGYVGVLTGMRPGAFSVSVDERGLSDPTTDIINNVLSALQVKYLMVVYPRGFVVFVV